MAERRIPRKTVGRLSPLAPLVALITGFLALTGQSQAAVTQVTGSAYGYQLKVTLFGGPVNTRGVGQEACTATNTPPGCADQADASASPSVMLPADGSATPVVGTKASSSGFVGPAQIFSSGQLDVSTQGTIGATGSVTSSAKIADVDKGGSESFGYGPKDTTTSYPKNPDGLTTTVTSTCTASETGVSGSTTITNGQLETDNGFDPTNNGTYAGGANAHPPVRVMVPINPPPNTSYEGHIEVNGAQDFFKFVFNEQVTNADGSLTVYAGHEYLKGPTAVGDLFFGKSQCGTGQGTGTTTATTGAGGTTTSTTTATATTLQTPVDAALASGSAASTPTGARLSLSSTQLTPGARTTLTGEGLPVSATLNLTFLSTPLSLGTVSTSATGGFQTAVTIPANAAGGAHQINVTDSGGRVLASVNLTVQASTITTTRGLARTGTGTGDMALLALAAVLFGSLVLVSQRSFGRRRR